MNFFINSQINLGPLVLSTSLLYILIGIAAGSILVIIITKNNRISRKIASDIITNFILIVILTWKLLPVFLAPKIIISSPVSIIYSSGGIPGIILGIGFGFVYLGINFFLYKKHSPGENSPLPLGNIIKPVVVFFAVVAVVSSSLFFVSRMIRGKYGNSVELIKKGTSTVGNIAPGFKLMDTSGNFISLDNYKGKWVIINFWATWCPPCRGELPTLIRFYAHADKEKIVLLGINATGTEKPTGGKTVNSYISAFATEKGINYRILLDPQGSVSNIYNAKTLPTTVIISPEGVITRIKTGIVDFFWLRTETN